MPYTQSWTIDRLGQSGKVESGTMTVEVDDEGKVSVSVGVLEHLLTVAGYRKTAYHGWLPEERIN